jgi:hypothetical protein
MARVQPASMRNVLLICRAVWAAMLCIQPFHLALFTLGTSLPPRAPDRDPRLLVGLAAAAVATSVASFVVPWVLRRVAVAKLSIATRTVPDPRALQRSGIATATQREYVDPLAARRKATSIEFVPFVLSLLLSYLVTLFGFAAHVAGHPPACWVPFVVVGMTLTAIRFPTARSILGAVEAKTGIPIPF